MHSEGLVYDCVEVWKARVELLPCRVCCPELHQLIAELVLDVEVLAHFDEGPLRGC